MYKYLIFLPTILARKAPTGLYTGSKLEEELTHRLNVDVTVSLDPVSNKAQMMMNIIGTVGGFPFDKGLSSKEKNKEAPSYSYIQVAPKRSWFTSLIGNVESSPEGENWEVIIQGDAWDKSLRKNSITVNKITVSDDGQIITVDVSKKFCGGTIGKNFVVDFHRKVPGDRCNQSDTNNIATIDKGKMSKTVEKDLPEVKVGKSLDVPRCNGAYSVGQVKVTCNLVNHGTELQYYVDGSGCSKDEDSDNEDENDENDENDEKKCAKDLMCQKECREDVEKLMSNEHNRVTGSLKQKSTSQFTLDKSII